MAWPDGKGKGEMEPVRQVTRLDLKDKFPRGNLNT